MNSLKGMEKEICLYCRSELDLHDILKGVRKDLETKQPWNQEITVGVRTVQTSIIKHFFKCCKIALMHVILNLF